MQEGSSGFALIIANCHDGFGILCSLYLGDIVLQSLILTVIRISQVLQKSYKLFFHKFIFRLGSGGPIGSSKGRFMIVI
jgi:hypothetical protein